MKRGRRFKTAFILGAGFGTRLRPLTDRCPKPLLEIGGRPIITYAMDHLIGIGIDRFIVNTHHCPEVYRQKFSDGHYRNIPVTLRREPVLLDTAGGLKNIEDLLVGDETILCYNGDILTDLPLLALQRFHDQQRPQATLVLRSDGPLLNVDLNENGEICDLRHTLHNPGTKRCLFAGIYAVETTILRHIEGGKTESIISTFLRRIKEAPGSIMGVVIDAGDWQDIGSLAVYERLRAQARPRSADENKE